MTSRRALAPLLVAAALVLVTGGPPHAEEETRIDVPAGAWRSLDRAAGLLGKKGRGRELETLLDVMTRLGRPAEDVSHVRASAEKALGRARSAADRVPDAAKEIARAAAAIAPGLATIADEAERRRLAGELLRLDATIVAAREALGHVREADVWMPPDMPAALERRARIADVQRRVQALDVPLEHGTSDMALLRHVHGKDGHWVRYRTFTVHAFTISPTKLERTMRESLRAFALSFALHGEEVRLPDVPDLTIVSLANEPEYLRAAEWALAADKVTPLERDHVKKMGGFLHTDGYIVNYDLVEAQHSASQLLHLYDERRGGERQPALDAGHLNWVCLAHLGVTLPNVAVLEERGGAQDTSTSPAESEERTRMLRLMDAGIAGTRAWMAWLAARRQDPPWIEAFEDQFGEVRGQELLKATIVAEYLFETGEFADVWKKTRQGHADAAAIEKAIGQPLAAFEERWRSWLLHPIEGLVQALGSPAVALTADEEKVLARLHPIRRATLEPHANLFFRPLTFDPELNEGCRAHARYLALHPDQAALWPDAHEERADREGFSARGARAGLNAVIAPGTERAEDAIDSWMATFYHRLPLLDPGLQRIGWGLEGRVAVLDAGSMVAPAERVFSIAWPHDGMRNVPLSFQPELPNPVEGEDQSKWGYPFTLQLYHQPAQPALRLRMHAGANERADVVPCHVSTPDAPTNPLLAPAGTWCLIPKQKLSSHATYTVVGEGFADGSRATWTFTTR
jgi:hypothetical protein